MKVFFISICLTFVTISAHGQKHSKKITCDYLTLFERWKLILNNDNSFILTTNSIFWPDTSITATGIFTKDGTTIQFYCDTSILQFKTLLKGDNTNEEVIAQSRAFKLTNRVINFKNVLRRVYDTLVFSSNIVATYYRGDGKWTCTITLFKNKTYEISESVHGNVEHSEKGQYLIKDDILIFTPSKKKSDWLTKYGNPKSFYFSSDFIVGHKRIDQEQETHYYFIKAPTDW
jgi:hypothetical protein